MPKTLSDQLSELAEAIQYQRERLTAGAGDGTIADVRGCLGDVVEGLWELAERAEKGGIDTVQTVSVHGRRGDGSQTHYLIEGHHPPIKPLQAQKS